MTFDNSTYSDFTKFGSSDDEYRSMKTLVSTEVEDTPFPNGQFGAVTANFQIADGSSIGGLFLHASGRIGGDFIGEVQDALADLLEFEEAVMTFIREAREALQDAEAYAVGEMVPA